MSDVIWKRKTVEIVKKRPSRFKRVIEKLSKTYIFKKIKTSSAALVVLMGGIILILLVNFTIFKSKYFEIKNFEIYGIEQLSEKDILAELNTYKGKNIFTLRSDNIESSVTSTSIFFKDIYIEKVIPDTINVYVVERYPKLVIVNLQGAFLVDDENIVIEVLSKTDGYNLTQTEKDILLGYAKLDNDLVKKKLTENLPEDQKTTFDMATVPTEQKQQVYDEIFNNLNLTVTTMLEQNTKGVSTTEFANLNRVFLYSNINYSIGTQINPKYATFSNEVLSYFLSNETYTPVKLEWVTDFTFLVSTLEGKQFVFTDRREIWLQIDDLDYMLEYLKQEGEDFTRIDVSTSVISVR